MEEIFDQTFPIVLGILLLIFLLGAAFNYFGFLLHQIALFIVGFVAGGALGFAADQGNIVLIVILCIAGGFVAIFAQYLAVFLVGAFLGGLIAGVTMPEPLVILLLGMLGGCVAVSLYRLGIVLITTFFGSTLMLYASLNIYALFSDAPGLASTGFSAYAMRVFALFLESEDMASFRSAMGLDVAFLLAFMFSGVVFQLRRMGSVSKARVASRPGSLVNKGPVEASCYGTGAHALPSTDSVKEVGSRSVAESERTTNGIDATRIAIANQDVFLSVYQERLAIDTVPLAIGSYLVGRGESCDICVKDSALGRAHFTLLVDQDGVWVEDLQSTNGLWFCGDERVDVEQMCLGDWVLAGSTQFLLHDRTNSHV
ncbi:MAG: FHA domain-containing protein [Nitrospira sp.]|nr:FHA domain-containing protein [Nitrospira sp.]